MKEPFSVIQNVFPLRARPGVDPYYMFHALRRSVPVTEYKGHWSDFIRLQVSLPPLDEQRRIAGVLGALDDKIELNRKMNETLEQMAQAIFKSWFIDFDGHTEFEDSELGRIPKGWRVVGLGDIVEILDSKRIPLSRREREARRGPYPYYGAASAMDSVDDYLFEGIHVLVGEDGSVVDDKGHPITQYVWGKFWVNNHAHVLRGTNGVSNELLLLFLRTISVSALVTGAVQPKLSQGNLKRIRLALPPIPETERFGTLVQPLFARIRHNTDESKTLAALRDTLLPKLISGELRIPEAEELVSSPTQLELPQSS